jgi:uncharacterized membrane protein
MKVTRKLLLGIVAGLGIFLIVYSLFRHFTGIGFGEQLEKHIIDAIVFAALAIFLYNRKLASDEKKAREAAEKAKSIEMEEDSEEEEGSGG